MSDLARSGDFHPLRRTFMCFHFGHNAPDRRFQPRRSRARQYSMSPTTCNPPCWEVEDSGGRAGHGLPTCRIQSVRRRRLRSRSLTSQKIALLNEYNNPQRHAGQSSNDLFALLTSRCACAVAMNVALGLSLAADWSRGRRKVTLRWQANPRRPQYPHRGLWSRERSGGHRRSSS